MDETPFFTLRLLGRFELQVGHEVPNLRRKTRALLAYLVAAQGVHSRQFLSELFFPETQDPLGALRWQLSQLRGAITADLLTIDRDTVGFNHLNTWIDCLDFRRRLDAQGASPRLDALAAALPLYRGEFLEGLNLPDAPEFELWLLNQRAVYQRLYVQTLEQVSAHYIAVQQYDAALAYTHRRLLLDPLAEATHLQLIWLYAQTGQRQAALRQYEQCCTLLREQLQTVPSAELEALYTQLVTEALPVQVIHALAAVAAPAMEAGSIAPSLPPLMPPDAPFPPRRHNLPAQKLPFWGRTQELIDLTTLLAKEDCRLVTIVGPGGVGKTRLALQVAAALATRDDQQWRDGVYFISLAGVTNSAALIPAVADTLGFSFSSTPDPAQQLLRFLQSQNLLLVLDNFEHLLDAAPFLAELLTVAVHVTLLVTSRVRLQLYEEWSFDLAGLELPPPAAEEDAAALVHFSAIQLFVSRAQQSRRTFVLADEQAAVIRICRLLDGIPLAIELAATWVRLYRCTEIAEQILHDLDFLAVDIRNIPERQRSMRAVFAHSWQLLTPTEQQAFAATTVFQGSFDYQAAMQICEIDLPTLAQLLDKSILQRIVTEQGANRYHLHELLRRFGAEKIAPQARERLQSRHSHYYATFAQQAAQAKMTPQEPQMMQAMGAEVENLRAGWQWALRLLAETGTPPAAVDSSVDTTNLTLTVITLIDQYAPMLAYYFERRSRYLEGMQLFQPATTALEVAGWFAPTPRASLAALKAVAAAKVSAGEALLCLGLSDFGRAEQLIERAITIFRRQQQDAALAEALGLLGRALWRKGENPAAICAFRESLTLSRRLGADATSGLALSGLASIASNYANFAEAEARYLESLALFRKIGAQREIVRLLNNFGSNYLRRGDNQQAKALYTEAFSLVQTLQEEGLRAVILSNLGNVARRLGEYQAAVTHLEESLRIFRRIGDQRWSAVSLNGLGWTWIATGQPALAAQHLCEALTIGMSTQSMADVLDSLVALCELMINMANHETAALILSFVNHHPITRTVAHARCQELLSQLHHDLAPALWTALTAQAAARDLEEIASLALTTVQ